MTNIMIVGEKGSGKTTLMDAFAMIAANINELGPQNNINIEIAEPPTLNIYQFELRNGHVEQQDITGDFNEWENANNIDPNQIDDPNAAEIYARELRNRYINSGYRADTPHNTYRIQEMKGTLNLNERDIKFHLTSLDMPGDDLTFILYSLAALSQNWRRRGQRYVPNRNNWEDITSHALENFLRVANDKDFWPELRPIFPELLDQDGNIILEDRFKILSSMAEIFLKELLNNTGAIVLLIPVTMRWMARDKSLYNHIIYEVSNFCKKYNKSLHIALSKSDILFELELLNTERYNNMLDMREKMIVARKLAEPGYSIRQDDEGAQEAIQKAINALIEELRNIWGLQAQLHQALNGNPNSSAYDYCFGANGLGFTRFRPIKELIKDGILFDINSVFFTFPIAKDFGEQRKPIVAIGDNLLLYYTKNLLSYIIQDLDRREIQREGD